MSGMSMISNEAILYAGVFRLSKSSTAVSSNGVEKMVMPRCFACANNDACQS